MAGAKRGRVSRRAMLKAAVVGTAGAIVPHAASAGSIEIATRDDVLVVTAAGHTTQVRITRPGVASVVSTAAVARSTDWGFFVDPGAPALPGVRVRRTDAAMHLTGPGITVTADRRTGRLSFGRSADEPRLRQAAPAAPLAGVPIAFVESFAVDPGDALLGLGQFRDGALDARGRTIFLAQSNMDAVNPFLVTTGGWGLLWDTGTAAYLRAEGHELSFHAVAGDVSRYHVVIGDGIDALIAGYRALTGAAQLLGKWAYGYWQSKERYQSQDELVAVVDAYRRRNLPLDNVVLDWRYWGDNDRFSGMVWDKAHFPDPKAMVAHVHAGGAHVIASVWPAFGPATAIYRDMAAGGHLFAGEHWSGGKVFDASDPQARAIYWRHIDAGLMSTGLDGLWTDGCEPEFMSTGNRYVTARAYAANGNEAAGPIVRNLLTFSYYQSRGLSEAMRRDYPARRPFILTRSVYPGQQAFGAVTWSGDIFASWGTLRNQIVAGLGMALSGNPHWTCDIGGFLVFHRYPDGLEDPGYRELYVRWFQFGAFLPVFRAHGTDIPRELWQFGEPGDPVYDALEAALRLRYALMPYIYATASQAARADDTIMRALAMDHPDDAEACAQTAQFGFGRALMVRVVDRPLFEPSARPHEFVPNEAVRGRSAPAAEIAFYEGANFERLVSRSLTDDLKLSWTGDLPAALRGKPYSVRITGVIRPAETGRHDFVVTAQGAVRMRLGGELSVDASGVAVTTANAANGGVSAHNNDSDRRYAFAANLASGDAVDFVIEQRQATADAISLWVEWLTPSQRALAQIPAAATVPVYLPAGRDWYDFHDFTRYPGGRTIDAAAPLARCPVFARAGAIVPMTPGITRAAERPSSIELHVFAGSDGAFELYDDAGDGDGYRSGACAQIPLRWREAERTLMIGARSGHFPGMPEQCRFRIFLHDGGPPREPRTVHYDGASTQVSLA